MPSVGVGRSFVHQVRLESNGEGRCDCCPDQYGYHIDLDFVPFSKKMLSSYESVADYERLKELKDKWRSDRQSMDKLLGVGKAKTLDGHHHTTISRTTKDVWEHRWEQIEQRREEKTSLSHSVGSELDGSSGSSERLLQNGLGEAVTDFEEALRRTRPQSKVLSYEIPDSQKFHTFPRIKAHKDSLGTTPCSSIFSNRGSSSTTTTSASTIVMRDAVRLSPKRSEESLGDFGGRGGLSEKMVGGGDKVTQHQVELDLKTKVIKDLEDKVQVLALEKKELEQLLEVERSICTQLRNNVVKLELELERQQDYGTEEDVPSKSLLTRDVGVAYGGPKMRTIGVGENVEMNWDGQRSRGGSQSPTSPTESMTGTLRRRVKTYEAGIQVKEYELPDYETQQVPVLQIVEAVDFGLQVGPGLCDEESTMKAPPRKKHAGVMVKPEMSDAEMWHKPSSRDAGTGAKEPPTPAKPRTKHVGISASLEELRHPSRAIAVNTEDVYVREVGINTIMDEIMPVRSCSSQTDLIQGEERERTPPPVAPRSLPLQISVSTPSLSTPMRSPGDRSQSKIPRLTSPGSPSSIHGGGVRGSASPSHERSESPVSPSSSSGRLSPAESPISYLRKPGFGRFDSFTKEAFMDRPMFGTLEPLEEEEREGPRSSASSSSGFAPPQEKREKISPSKEMQAALKVLNDALLRGHTTQNVTSAISIILHEWFRIAGTKTANPYDVEDYLDSFEIYSPQLLRYIVNMPDGNGNTALHYAVSHGNFDVVSVLLDSKVCDPNKTNKAGYTSIMLVALANITCEAHRQVVRRLFSMGDVNIKAQQHGQTALMLGSSHGRIDTVRLLLEAGADINIQDEDGSTALMCAAEHGHTKIVKYLISHADCDLSLTDNDGSTAFSIAMEGSHKDIGVLLYAQMHFGSSTSVNKSRSTTPSAGSQNSSRSSSSNTSPIASKRQQQTSATSLTPSDK